MPARKTTAAALIAKYGKSKPKGPRCGVMLSSRRALIEELSAAGMAHSNIAFTLREEYGEKLSAQIVGRHLKGQCACPTK